MTASSYWVSLALLTLRNPSEAAEQILGWRLPRDVLWTALALVAAINTIIFTLSNFLLPSNTAMPLVFNSPIAFFLIIAGGLVVTVHALYWTGRMMGGTGDLGDMLALMIWLQALRAVAQAAVLVFMLIAPGVAVLLILGAGLFALWLLLNFVSSALNFQSLTKAAMVLIASTVAVVLGLSLLLSMIGVTALGIPANV